MKQFSALCTASTQLGKLSQYSGYLNGLNRWLQSWLPMPLNQHVKVANFNQAVLILHVDSPAWVTQLRFMTGKIQQQWQQHWTSLPKIVQIQIKVRPFVLTTPKAVQAKMQISKDNIQLIESVAQTTADAKLKAALQRLAEHAKTGD
jgi:hypothetical protein